MLDVRFFKNRRFTAANIAVTLVFFAMFGQGFIGTQYLQTVLGFTALRGRAPGLPMAITDGDQWRRSHLGWSNGSAPSSSSGGGLLIVAVGLGVDRDRAGHRRLPAHPHRHLILGLGMGLADGARHRVDHGLPSPVEGRGRLGHERHDQADGWGPRRRHHRVGLRQRVPARGGRAVRRRRARRRGLARARDSIAGAVQVAARASRASSASNLLDIAKTQFVDGMSTSLVVAIVARARRRRGRVRSSCRPGPTTPVRASGWPARRPGARSPSPRPRACSSATPPRRPARSTRRGGWPRAGRGLATGRCLEPTRGRRPR